MRIDSLDLVHFRNYNHFFIEFHHGINILIGDNAQGKTNLIEAIYLLSVCKSFRSHKNNQMIQFDEDFAKVKGKIFSNQQRHDLEIILSLAYKKAKVDDIDILKMSDYVGYLNVVVFVPEDLSLVKGSPSTRRRFMDMELSKMSPIYVFHLSRYNKLLKERNQYLKMIAKKRGHYDEYLETLDEQLAKIQVLMIQKRFDFIQRLNRLASYVYQKMSLKKESIQLEYDCFHFNHDENDILESYRKSFSRDVKYQQTHYGIHKDDLKIFIEDKMASQYASQGQQRTIVLSLKIALVYLIQEEIGEYPVLLLDDVLSELDDSRKNQLLNLLNDKIQTFITATSIDGIEHVVINQARKIDIKEEKYGRGNESRTQL